MAAPRNESGVPSQSGSSKSLLATNLIGTSITVTIVRAQDLPNLSDAIDSFVKLHFGEEDGVKTRTVNNNTSPEFNQTFTMTASSTILSVSLFDSNMMSNKFICGGNINLTQSVQDSPAWVSLYNTSNIYSGKVLVSWKSLAIAAPAIGKLSIGSTIYVEVMRGVDLANAGAQKDVIDSYFRVHFDEKDNGACTRVINNNPNPQFFEVLPVVAKSTTMLVTMYDKDMITSDSNGRGVVNLTEQKSNESFWVTLTKNNTVVGKVQMKWTLTIDAADVSTPDEPLPAGTQLYIQVLRGKGFPNEGKDVIDSFVKLAANESEKGLTTKTVNNNQNPEFLQTFEYTTTGPSINAYLYDKDVIGSNLIATGSLHLNRRGIGTPVWVGMSNNSEPRGALCVNYFPIDSQFAPGAPTTRNTAAPPPPQQGLPAQYTQPPGYQSTPAAPSQQQSSQPQYNQPPGYQPAPAAPSQQQTSQPQPQQIQGGVWAPPPSPGPSVPPQGAQANPNGGQVQHSYPYGHEGYTAASGPVYNSGPRFSDPRSGVPMEPMGPSRGSPRRSEYGSSSPRSASEQTYEKIKRAEMDLERATRKLEGLLSTINQAIPVVTNAGYRRDYSSPIEQGNYRDFEDYDPRPRLNPPSYTTHQVFRDVPRQNSSPTRRSSSPFNGRLEKEAQRWSRGRSPSPQVINRHVMNKSRDFDRSTTNLYRSPSPRRSPVSNHHGQRGYVDSRSREFELSPPQLTPQDNYHSATHNSPYGYTSQQQHSSRSSHSFHDKPFMSSASYQELAHRGAPYRQNMYDDRRYDYGDDRRYDRAYDDERTEFDPRRLDQIRYSAQTIHNRLQKTLQ